jgi:uncharacterized protein (TIGR02453 family)
MTNGADERKQILTFLKNLIENNNREWFQRHRGQYELMRANLERLVNQLGEGLHELDPSFRYTKSSDYTFRIYRDVRFSKDKRPYKNHIGIYLINGGRKSPNAGYYVHIQPGESFVAGGLWRPPKEILKAVRSEIYFNPNGFESVVLNRDFIRHFGALWDEDKLIRNPKDFPGEGPAAEWLKYKSFIASKPFSDADFLSPRFIETTMNTFRKLKVFNDFLNQAIMMAEED